MKKKFSNKAEIGIDKDFHKSNQNNNKATITITNPNISQQNNKENKVSFLGKGNNSNFSNNLSLCVRSKYT